MRGAAVVVGGRRVWGWLMGGEKNAGKTAEENDKAAKSFKKFRLGMGKEKEGASEGQGEVFEVGKGMRLVRSGEGTGVRLRRAKWALDDWGKENQK